MKEKNKTDRRMMLLNQNNQPEDGDHLIPTIKHDNSDYRLLTTTHDQNKTDWRMMPTLTTRTKRTRR
jgi:hypothetical protein